MTTTRSSTAKVCLYDDHLAETLHEFCRKVWPDSESDDSQKGFGLPSGQVSTGDRLHKAPIFLFVKDEKAIGHVATIPVRLHASSRIISAHWIVGFMVLPEYRNGLVGPFLIKEVNRVLDCALSLHVEESVLRILTGLNWVHKGVLPQYIYVLDAGAVIKNLRPVILEKWTGSGRLPWLMPLVDNRFINDVLSGGLASVQYLWCRLAAVVKSARLQTTIVEEREFDDSYTDLWQSVSAQIKAALVRDREALRARYERKMDRYRLLACRREGKLLGYCILKVRQYSCDPRMTDMRVGTIVDCLYAPASPAVLQALVARAIELFIHMGVNAVLCTASLREARQVLVRRGFFRIPGNLHFAYHARSAQDVADVPLESWHLMRGDSDADQNF